eukprot:757991-Hanusia_phi.AAC.3
MMRTCSPHPHLLSLATSLRLLPPSLPPSPKHPPTIPPSLPHFFSQAPTHHPSLPLPSLPILSLKGLPHYSRAKLASFSLLFPLLSSSHHAPRTAGAIPVCVSNVSELWCDSSTLLPRQTQSLSDFLIQFPLCPLLLFSPPSPPFALDLLLRSSFSARYPPALSPFRLSLPLACGWSLTTTSTASRRILTPSATL